MKIVEIIPQLSSGGAERFTVDLCNALSENHDVTLIVLHSLDEHDFFASEVSQKVRLMSMNKRKGLDLSLLYRLYDILKSISPDVVHTHLRGLFYSIPFILLNRNTKGKSIHTVHNDAFKEASSWFDRAYRRVLFSKFYTCPVTISEDSYRSFEELYGLRSTLIYNGRPSANVLSLVQEKNILQEFNECKVNPQAMMILNVARMEHAKNQWSLAEAIELLNQRGYQVELAIIGRISKKLLDRYPILQSVYVHLLGEKKNPRDYMRIADAFCLSSVYEGMPISLIESFSVGTIPICTPVGGMVNMIVDGENGILTRGTTADDIAQAIERFLLLSYSEKDQMQEKACDSFVRYSMETCVSSYVSLFQNLVSSPNLTPSLAIGARYGIGKKAKLGGVVVLFENWLEYCDRQKENVMIIDTNKANYSNVLFAYIVIIMELIRTARRVSYLALHGTNKDYSYIGPVAVFLARVFNKPIYLRKFGGSFETYYSGSSKMHRCFLDYVLKNATALFWETKSLVKFGQMKNKASYWFPNGRSISSTQRDSSPFSGRFVFVSQVRRGKGIDLLTAVFKNIKSDIHLDIYGPLFEHYDADNLHGEKYDYKGILHPEDVAKTIANYDVLILPTLFPTEGYPGIIIEAFSAGIPVIASNIGGISEIVRHGVNGFLIEPGDENSLMTLLTNFPVDKYLSLCLGARKSFNNYNSDIVNGEMLQIMKTFLKDREE